MPDECLNNEMYRCCRNTIMMQECFEFNVLHSCHRGRILGFFYLGGIQLCDDCNQIHTCIAILFALLISAHSRHSTQMKVLICSVYSIIGLYMHGGFTTSQTMDKMRKARFEYTIHDLSNGSLIPPPLKPCRHSISRYAAKLRRRMTYHIWMIMSAMWGHMCRSRNASRNPEITNTYAIQESPFIQEINGIHKSKYNTIVSRQILSMHRDETRCIIISFFQFWHNKFCSDMLFRISFRNLRFKFSDLTEATSTFHVANLNYILIRFLEDVKCRVAMYNAILHNSFFVKFGQLLFKSGK